MSKRLSKEELSDLTKNQLISYILKNTQPINEGGPKMSINNPPPGFDNIKLPPKPNFNPNNILITPKDYGPLDQKPIAAPPPIPDSPLGPGKKNIISEKEAEGTKKIFVKCERCDETFIIDLPRKLVLTNPLEVVPVTLLHAEDHALTVYLDQNFESRRDYISEIFKLN